MSVKGGDTFLSSVVVRPSMSSNLSDDSEPRTLEYRVRIRFPSTRNKLSRQKAVQVVNALNRLRKMQTILGQPACTDESARRLHSFVKSRFEGAFPKSIKEVDTERFLAAVLRPLCTDIDTAVMYMLASEYGRHFDLWWNPKHMPHEALVCMPRTCKEHRQIWEPYYAAMLLTNPEYTGRDYAIAMMKPEYVYRWWYEFEETGLGAGGI